MKTSNKPLGIWFPAIRTNTGTDVFTERLVKGLSQRGIKAEITWLPLRAEYAPWSVAVPKPPEWATVIHVNTWLHPRFIPKTLPVVTTIHHAIHHPDTMSYKGWLRAAYHKFWIVPIERRILKRANKVIAVSQFVANTAKQTLLDVPMPVIYNGIDTEVYRPDPNVKKPHKPFRLLFVGSWKKLKGADLLAPIMSELGNDFELYYTGGAAAEKDKASMPKNMHDIGRLNGDAEVVKAMQNADALLFPSRSEGFGLVAAEAMACGLPVITMEGTSVVEVLENGVNGYLCKRDDISDFVITIRNLKAVQEQYLIMSNAARTNAVESFSDQTMIDASIDLYEQLPR